VKCGARVALGIAGGYLLGRTKKMKLALMVGGLAAGRKAGGPGQLLAQGTKLIGQSPELTRLTDEVRGRLLDAGKAAALAVATRQVETLTERVVGRVGTLTDVGGKAVGDVGETTGDVGRTVADVGQRMARGPRQDDDQDEDRYDSADDSADDEDVLDDEGGPDDEDVAAEEDEGAVDEDLDDEDVDDEDAGAPPVEEPPPAPRRASRTAATTRRTGVPRAGSTAGSAAGRTTGRRPGRAARTQQGGTGE
jgi:hypothetical protein